MQVLCFDIAKLKLCDSRSIVEGELCLRAGDGKTVIVKGHYAYLTGGLIADNKVFAVAGKLHMSRLFSIGGQTELFVKHTVFVNTKENEGFAVTVCAVHRLFVGGEADGGAMALSLKACGQGGYALAELLFGHFVYKHLVGKLGNNVEEALVLIEYHVAGMLILYGVDLILYFDLAVLDGVEVDYVKTYVGRK